MIHLVDQSGKEQKSFTITSGLGVYAIDFSYDGQWIFVLGGLPTFRLSAFEWRSKVEELAYCTYDSPIGNRLSVCPAKSRLFAVFGNVELGVPDLPPDLRGDPPPSLRFFTLQGCGENFRMAEVASQLHDPVISLAWSPKLYQCYVSTSKGEVITVDAVTGHVLGDPLKMSSFGDGEQVASALICTANYLIVAGTKSNLYWVNLENFTRAEELVVETYSPILYLKFLPGSSSVFCGTEANSLMCIDLDPDSQQLVNNSMINIRDGHRGPIAGAVCLPHHLATAGHDGTLRFWSYYPLLSLVQKVPFPGDKLTAIAASPGGTLVAVGSASGLVRIFNTTDPLQPTLLFRERLHSSAVTSIVISAHHICSGSTTGSLAILKTDPLSVFPLIGLVQLKTGIVSLANPPALSSSQQLFIATIHREVLRIDLPDEASDDFRIGLETLNRTMLKVATRIMAIASEPTLREDQQYFYCACDDKTVKYYGMPITSGDLDIVGSDDVESSAPDDVFRGHSKAVTATQLSPNQFFVATGCAGGSIIIREIDAKTAQVQSTLFNATHHSPMNGAITAIAFSPDGRKLFSTGFDGVVNMYSMKVQPCAMLTDRIEMPKGIHKISVSKIFAIEQQIKELKAIWAKRDYDYDGDDPFETDDDTPGFDETSLVEQVKIQRAKDQEQEALEHRDAILEKLKSIEDEFMQLVKENGEATELEQLSQHDFTLDVVSAEKLQQLAQLRVELVHYRRRIKNQIRSLIAQTITNQCFKPYEPKLTTLVSFKTTIHFDNFPLPVPDKAALRRYHCITMLRRTEIAALRYNPPSDPNRVPLPAGRDASLDGGRYLSSRSNSLVTLTPSETDQDVIVKDSVLLLYDPFQMVTANRRITQLHVVQNLILEEMGRFNVVFEDMLGRKQALVASLQEKNKRIRQLVRILKFNIEDYEIFDPQPADDETPEAFLTVKDGEVHLRKQVDQGDKTQEATDELEKDSFGERALREMMGGNVNVNMEEAPQDDEPVRPEWMDTKKKEDMTEEEQYQIQEFDKKLKNFIEEREKRRKALTAELSKLVKGNLASVDEFDKQMCQTYMTRFDSEERIYYHELEIMHLMEGVNLERKFRLQLNDVSNRAITEQFTVKQKESRYTQLKELSTQLNEAAVTAETNLENLKSQVMKEFKNKDCVNTLKKLFDGVARRIVPKVANGANVFQQFVQFPFVFTDDKAELHASQPSSLAESPWRNFLEYCEKKVHFGKDAAEKTAEAADLKVLLRAFDEEIETVRVQLKNLGQKQSELGDQLLGVLVDVHVPFTFRQGQVEIPSDIVLIDWSDVVLIDKKVVMDRNRLILEAGKRKLDELENIRQQRSNHKSLRWEIDKCKVDLENLGEEVKEYQLFRVKKSDLELIMGGGKNRNQSEVNSLNNSLQHTQKTHVIRLQRAKSSLKQLQHKVARKKAENSGIEAEILQMQLALKERKRIYTIQMRSTEGASEARKTRLKQVMWISKLKRHLLNQQAKMQEQQEEVARLRKCVYPSFEGSAAERGTMVGYSTDDK
jgi:WD40 repeat protein